VRANLAVSDFARRVLAARGALVEPGEGGTLEAVLPPGLADRLGTDFLRLCFDPAGPHSEGELVTLGSGELDRLGELLGEDGFYDEREVSVPYLKREGLEKAVRDAFTFSGIRARFLGTDRGPVSYLTFHVRFSALSDERRDGLVKVVLNEVSGAEVGDIEEEARVAGLVVRAPDASRKEAPVLPLEGLLSKAVERAEKAVREDLSDFRRSMDRRLGRDIARVEEYFEGIRSGASRKRGRAGSTAAERLRAVDLEEKAKRRDIAARYAVRVESSLVCVRRIFVPSVLVRFTLARGSRAREVVFFWSPVVKGVEPLSCEDCGAETFTPGICDGGHRVCASCERSCPRATGTRRV